MDTYFKCDWNKCIGCRACTEVCNELYMSHGTPSYADDYVRCHHCHGKKDESGNKIIPPCQVVCPVDALDWERW